MTTYLARSVVKDITDKPFFALIERSKTFIFEKLWGGH